MDTILSDSMSESVKHYLSRLSPRTRPVVEVILNRYIEWLSEAGGDFRDYGFDELVQYQRENPGSYEVLDTIQAWINDLGDLRKNTTKRYYSAVRSLFAHSRVALPKDPSYRITNGADQVIGRLKVAEIRRVIESSPPNYRALFTCMAQSFMGIGEAVHWSNTGLKDLEAHIETDTHPVRIEFSGGRKLNPRPYFTYLGKDAITELKIWLEMKPSSADQVFVTQWKTPLTRKTASRFWTERLKKLGIITAKELEDTSNRTIAKVRYGKNLHEIRDCMRSRFRLSGIPVEVCEFFMGHSQALDQYGYDKSPWQYPEHFREQYLKAEPWLNILTEDPETVPRSQHQKTVATVQDLRSEINELRELFEELKRQRLR